MSRPATTILFLSTARLARVDVASDGRVLASSVRARDEDSLRASVQVLLQAGGKPGKRTRIVAETLWTQVLSLPNASVDGLGAEELGRALAYELEPSSGLPAADAAVGHVALAQTDGALRHVWATQVSLGERDELARLVVSHGSRLDWLAHPAGLLAPEPGPRIEVWSNATLCDEPARGVQVIAAAAGRRTWEREVAAWLLRAPQAPVQLRASAELAELLASDTRVTRDPSLESEETLVAALANLAAAQDSPRFPRIEAARRARLSFGPALFGLAATAMIVGLSVWDLRTLERDARDLEAQVARVEAAAAKAQGLRREQRELSTALAQREPDLAARRSRIERAETLLAAQSERSSRLLEALGAHANPEIVLLELATQPGGATRIAGLAARAPAIEAFATALAPDMTTLGLLCEPASVQRRTGVDSGEAREFSLVVRPVTTAELAQRTSPR